MNKLKVNFQHCYGIKSLKQEFEFKNNSKAFSIYAQNGVMKTSFAKTFDDYSKDEETQDRLFQIEKL